uniref:Uncharacterized protein n=1 Tax=viral metagenome TaxID=1070528 RepID=A0A6C0CGD0_9ZZZZ
MPAARKIPLVYKNKGLVKPYRPFNVNPPKPLSVIKK